MKVIKLYIPKSWDEMSEKQLEKLAFLFNTSEPSAKYDWKIFYILLDIKWWQFTKKAKFRIVLWDIPMSEIRKNYDFIFKENNRTVFPKVIKIKRTEYFAPQDRIANLTAHEFSVVDDLHIQWRKTSNIEYLHYMTAVLYTDTKKRPVFNKDELHDKALFFKNTPLKQLFAMEIAYFGCKNNLVKRFKRAFPKPTPGALEPKKKYGFGKVILSMAKDDLSKLESIQKVNIYAFLEQFEEDLTPSKK